MTDDAPPPSRSFPADVGAPARRAEVWRAALERNRGNISATAREYGFSKPRGVALTRETGLTAFARELRLADGQAATGRPRKPAAAELAPARPRGRPRKVAVESAAGAGAPSVAAELGPVQPGKRSKKG